MRRLVPALVALAALAAAAPSSPLAAQSRPVLQNRNPRPVAWTLAGGISASWGELDDHVVHTGEGPLLVGGADPGPHVAAGAVWGIPSSALELRAEAFYNQLRGPTNTVLGTMSGQTARMATRDRVFAAGTTLLWHARPGRAFSPYLLTGLALYHTRLTSDPTTDEPNGVNASGTGPGISAGVGVQAPIVGRVIFAEVRRHMVVAENVRGADFLPITLGMRF